MSSWRPAGGWDNGPSRTSSSGGWGVGNRSCRLCGQPGGPGGLRPGRHRAWPPVLFPPNHPTLLLVAQNQTRQETNKNRTKTQAAGLGSFCDFPRTRGAATRAAAPPGPHRSLLRLLQRSAGSQRATQRPTGRQPRPPRTGLPGGWPTLPTAGAQCRRGQPGAKTDISTSANL